MMNVNNYTQNNRHPPHHRFDQIHRVSATYHNTLLEAEQKLQCSSFLFICQVEFILLKI